MLLIHIRNVDSDNAKENSRVIEKLIRMKINPAKSSEATANAKTPTDFKPIEDAANKLNDVFKAENQKKESDKPDMKAINEAIDAFRIAVKNKNLLEGINPCDLPASSQESQKLLGIDIGKIQEMVPDKKGEENSWEKFEENISVFLRTKKVSKDSADKIAVAYRYLTEKDLSPTAQKNPDNYKLVMENGLFVAKTEEQIGNKNLVNDINKFELKKGKDGKEEPELAKPADEDAILNLLEGWQYEKFITANIPSNTEPDKIFEVTKNKLLENFKQTLKSPVKPEIAVFITRENGKLAQKIEAQIKASKVFDATENPDNVAKLKEGRACISIREGIKVELHEDENSKNDRDQEVLHKKAFGSEANQKKIKENDYDELVKKHGKFMGTLTFWLNKIMGFFGGGTGPILDSRSANERKKVEMEKNLNDEKSPYKKSADAFGKALKENGINQKQKDVILKNPDLFRQLTNDALKVSGKKEPDSKDLEKFWVDKIKGFKTNLGIKGVDAYTYFSLSHLTLLRNDNSVNFDLIDKNYQILAKKSKLNLTTISIKNGDDLKKVHQEFKEKNEDKKNISFSYFLDLLTNSD